MTTIVLPPRAAVVPALPGDAGVVEDFASALLAVSAVFDDLDSLATSHVTPDGWEGEAATAFSARVHEVATDAGTMSLALRAVSRAAQAHGDEITRLRTVRDTLVDDRTDYNAELTDLAADVAQSTEEDVPGLRERADVLRLRYDRLTEDVTQLGVDATANDDRFRAVLATHATLPDARAATAGGDVADAAMRRAGAPGSGAEPAAVAAWWAGLTEAQRQAVIAACPDLIGSADGLPTAVRDQANRLLLANDLAMLGVAEERGQLTAEQQRMLENVRAAALALDRAATTRDPITGEPVPALLHLYDPKAFDYDGAIAIAVGDPDTADNVTTLVPGINTEGTSAAQYADAAAAIYGSARLSDRYSSTATLMWIGYDAPSGWDLTNTPTEGAATAGGDALARYVDGLVAARGDHQPHLTVIGHSYGSTTMAHAASDHVLAVDDLVFLGSPGAGGGVDHASDLGGPEVWVGNASRDFVARIADDGWVGGGTLFGAGLGRDVAEDAFGAHRFQAESVNRSTAEDPWTPDPFYGSSDDDHLRYWEQGSESLYNLGQIVVGDDAEVVAADPVHDPWWGAPVDPEYDRVPTNDLNRKPDDP